MNIYVETNFLLEIAYEQEQEQACLGLLELVEKSPPLQLAVPAFCYSEALWNLRGRGKERQALQQQVERALREIRRTRSLKEHARGDLAGLLTQSIQDGESRLEKVRERLTHLGEVLLLTREVFLKAAELSEAFGLQEPDAVVLATVILDMKRSRSPGWFLTRNSRDFDASVKESLSTLDCTLMTSFDAGLERIRRALQALPAP